MPLLTTDRALLSAFRAGDKAGLARVYEAYAPSLAEFLRNGFAIQAREETVLFRGFRKVFELENAVQEVFARAFKERARLAYDGLRPYVNYLFAIGRNYVVDEYRKRDAALRCFSPTTPDNMDEVNRVADPDLASDPEMVAEEHEVDALLAQFLGTCEPKLVRYYELRCRDHLTQDEVASAMGLTRIQIRRIEVRFRQRLLAHLKGQGYLSGFKLGALSLSSPTGAALVLMLLGGSHVL